jgi:pilus assembly protein CpaC
LISLILFLSLRILAQVEVKQEFVGLGETKILRGLGSNIQIPRQDTFVVQKLNDQVVLKAKKPGFAIVKSNNKVYEVSAVSIRQLRTYFELKKRLKDIPGVNVTVKKGRVRLEGSIPFIRLLDQLKLACHSLSCDYENHLAVPKYFQDKVRSYIYDHIQEKGFSGGQVLFAPSWKMLWPRQKIKKDDALPELELFGIESEYSPQSLKIEPGVRVQMLIAEIRKQNISQMGISWPTQLSAQVLPENGIFDPAFMTLNWAEQAGVGRTLASPSLLVKSGGQAEFMAGGEIPIRLVGERVNALQWKRYGILLKLEVKTDYSGRMSLGVECEVSSVDGAITVEGVPGFKTNRVSTYFDLLEPRTLILSGLLKSDESHAAAGLKGLTSLPIIGPLFSSQDFREDKSELIILLRPELILPKE